MTVADQARAFLGMTICGACIGAAHDLLSAGAKRAFLAAMADLALGILGGLAVIAAALMMQCEPFRLYALLGVSLGWAMYGFSLGTVVRKLTKDFTICQKKLQIGRKKTNSGRKLEKRDES